MKQYLFLLLLSLFVASCTSNKKDIHNAYLAGQVVYQNSKEAGGAWIPLANKQIKIAKQPSDTLNYITTLQTDQNGYFVSEGLRKNDKYLLFYNDSINGVRYKGELEAITNNEALQLKLLPDSLHQNGYVLTVMDDSRSFVPNANVCIFKNANAWNTDTCLNSQYSLPVSPSGQGTEFGIPSGKYYFLATAMIGNKFYRAKDSISVHPVGITRETLLLQPVPVTGFEITVHDPYSTPVNNAQICVFTTYSFFLADTCLNRQFELFTDSIGKATRTNLSPGTYYLRVTAPAGSKLKKLDSIKVVSNAIAKDTIQLQ